MNSALRSKQGCWTCRLRRKKCDERQPICVTCEQLKITCHGYGPKPTWMDGGAQEKAMIDQIKQIVKHTSRRKGRLNTALSRFQRKEEVPVLAPKLAPAPTAIAPAIAVSPESEGANTTNGGGSEYTQEHTNNQSSPNSSVETRTMWESSPALPPDFSSEDAILLMHFIDNVFPLQYPVYKPSVAEGGRGWVISLLLRTKPLYHACLALASFHRGAVLLEVKRGPCSSAVVIEQERHLAICLKDFLAAVTNLENLVGGAYCPKNNLGLMACIVQLIYFELFAGHNNWRVHLKGATAAFGRGYYLQLEELGMLRGREAIWDPEEDTQSACAPNEKKAVFRFMGGIILWLDAISSITLGTSPTLLEFHSHALSNSSHIKMENIMGCHNWTLLLIGRISSLHEHKVQLELTGCTNTNDWQTQVGDIKARLQEELTQMCLMHLQLDQTGPISFGLAFISRMFAFSAATYLHLVTHGFDTDDEMLSLLRTEAMMVLRAQAPAEMMHIIIFPLFMVGCIASLEDQPFFRYVFSTMPVLDPSLEHRGKILPLLEQIWQRRELIGGLLSWEDALKLADQSLLLI